MIGAPVFPFQCPGPGPRLGAPFTPARRLLLHLPRPADAAFLAAFFAGGRGTGAFLAAVFTAFFIALFTGLLATAFFIAFSTSLSTAFSTVLAALLFLTFFLAILKFLDLFRVYTLQLGIVHPGLFFHNPFSDVTALLPSSAPRSFCQTFPHQAAEKPFDSARAYAFPAASTPT